MLLFEILLLIFITREIEKSVAITDREPKKFKTLAIMLWIIGELSGIIIGTLLGASWWIAYLVGIFGGIVGALVIFAIVGNLPESQDEKAMLGDKMIQPPATSSMRKSQTEIEALYVIGGFIGIFGLTILGAVFFLKTKPEQITNLISAVILLIISASCFILGRRKKRAQAE